MPEKEKPWMTVEMTPNTASNWLELVMTYTAIGGVILVGIGFLTFCLITFFSIWRDGRVLREEKPEYWAALLRPQCAAAGGYIDGTVCYKTITPAIPEVRTIIPLTLPQALLPQFTTASDHVCPPVCGPEKQLEKKP